MAERAKDLFLRTGIIDPDTVQIEGERVRVAGINAPEVFDEQGRYTPEGLARTRQAAAFLPENLSAQHLSRQNTGYYGRTVGDINSPDGSNYGDTLVARGLATSRDYNDTGRDPRPHGTFAYARNQIGPTEVIGEEPRAFAGYGSAKPSVWKEFERGLASGVDHTQASAFGFGSLLASLITPDAKQDPKDDTLIEKAGRSFRNVMEKGYARNMEEAHRNAAKYTLEELVKADDAGVDDWMRWGLFTLGSAVPSMAGMIGPGLALKGAGHIGKAVIGRALEKRFAQEAGKALARKQLDEKLAKELSYRIASNLPKWGFRAGSFAGSAVPQAGDLFKNIQNEYGKESQEAALMAGALQGSLDVIGMEVLLGALLPKGILGPVVGKTLPRRILKGMAQAGLLGVVGEAPTEFLQEVIGATAMELENPDQSIPLEDRLTSEDRLWGYAEAAAAGALFGGVFGGAGGALKGVVGRTPEQQQRIEDEQKARVEAERLRQQQGQQQGQQVPSVGEATVPETERTGAAERPSQERAAAAAAAAAGGTTPVAAGTSAPVQEEETAAEEVPSTSATATPAKDATPPVEEKAPPVEGERPAATPASARQYASDEGGKVVWFDQDDKPLRGSAAADAYNSSYNNGEYELVYTYTGDAGAKQGRRLYGAKYVGKDADVQTSDRVVRSLNETGTFSYQGKTYQSIQEAVDDHVSRDQLGDLNRDKLTEDVATAALNSAPLTTVINVLRDSKDAPEDPISRAAWRVLMGKNAKRPAPERVGLLKKMFKGMTDLLLGRKSDQSLAERRKTVLEALRDTAERAEQLANRSAVQQVFDYVFRGEDMNFNPEARDLSEMLPTSNVEGATFNYTEQEKKALSEVTELVRDFEETANALRLKDTPLPPHVQFLIDMGKQLRKVVEKGGSDPNFFMIEDLDTISTIYAALKDAPVEQLYANRGKYREAAEQLKVLFGKGARRKRINSFAKRVAQAQNRSVASVLADFGLARVETESITAEGSKPKSEHKPDVSREKPVKVKDEAEDVKEAARKRKEAEAEAEEAALRKTQRVELTVETAADGSKVITPTEETVDGVPVTFPGAPALLADGGTITRVETSVKDATITIHGTQRGKPFELVINLKGGKKKRVTFNGQLRNVGKAVKALFGDRFYDFVETLPYITDIVDSKVLDAAIDAILGKDAHKGGSVVRVIPKSKAQREAEKQRNRDRQQADKDKARPAAGIVDQHNISLHDLIAKKLRKVRVSGKIVENNPKYIILRTTDGGDLRVKVTSIEGDVVTFELLVDEKASKSNALTQEINRLRDIIKAHGLTDIKLEDILNDTNYTLDEKGYLIPHDETGQALLDKNGNEIRLVTGRHAMRVARLWSKAFSKLMLPQSYAGHTKYGNLYELAPVEMTEADIVATKTVRDLLTLHGFDEEAAKTYVIVDTEGRLDADFGTDGNLLGYYDPFANLIVVGGKLDRTQLEKMPLGTQLYDRGWTLGHEVSHMLDHLVSKKVRDEVDPKLEKLTEEVDKAWKKYANTPELRAFAEAKDAVLNFKWDDSTNAIDNIVRYTQLHAQMLVLAGQILNARQFYAHANTDLAANIDDVGKIFFSDLTTTLSAENGKKLIAAAQKGALERYNYTASKTEWFADAGAHELLSDPRSRSLIGQFINKLKEWWNGFFTKKFIQPSGNAAIKELYAYLQKTRRNDVFDVTAGTLELRRIGPDGKPIEMGYRDARALADKWNPKLLYDERTGEVRIDVRSPAMQRTFKLDGTAKNKAEADEMYARWRATHPQYFWHVTVRHRANGVAPAWGLRLDIWRVRHPIEHSLTQAEYDLHEAVRTASKELGKAGQQAFMEFMEFRRLVLKDDALVILMMRRMRENGIKVRSRVEAYHFLMQYRDHYGQAVNPEFQADDDIRYYTVEALRAVLDSEDFDAGLIEEGILDSVTHSAWNASWVAMPNPDDTKQMQFTLKQVFGFEQGDAMNMLAQLDHRFSDTGDGAVSLPIDEYTLSYLSPEFVLVLKNTVIALNKELINTNPESRRDADLTVAQGLTKAEQELDAAIASKDRDAILKAWTRVDEILARGSRHVLTLNNASRGSAPIQMRLRVEPEYQGKRTDPIGRIIIEVRTAPDMELHPDPLVGGAMSTMQTIINRRIDMMSTQRMRDRNNPENQRGRNTVTVIQRPNGGTKVRMLNEYIADIGRIALGMTKTHMKQSSARMAAAFFEGVNILLEQGYTFPFEGRLDGETNVSVKVDKLFGTIFHPDTVIGVRYVGNEISGTGLRYGEVTLSMFLSALAEKSRSDLTRQIFVDALNAARDRINTLNAEIRDLVDEKKELTEEAKHQRTTRERKAEIDDRLHDVENDIEQKSLSVARLMDEQGRSKSTMDASEKWIEALKHEQAQAQLEGRTANAPKRTPDLVTVTQPDGSVVMLSTDYVDDAVMKASVLLRAKLEVLRNKLKWWRDRLQLLEMADEKDVEKIAKAKKVIGNVLKAFDKHRKDFALTWVQQKLKDALAEARAELAKNPESASAKAAVEELTRITNADPLFEDTVVEFLESYAQSATPEQIKRWLNGEANLEDNSDYAEVQHTVGLDYGESAEIDRTVMELFTESLPDEWYRGESEVDPDGPAIPSVQAVDAVDDPSRAPTKLQKEQRNLRTRDLSLERESLTEDLKEPKVENRKSKLSDAKIDARIREIDAELAKDLEEKIKLPASAGPRWRRFVEVAYKLLGFDRLNVKLEVEMTTAGETSMTIYQSPTEYGQTVKITINSDLSAWHKVWAFAHEMGHAVLELVFMNEFRNNTPIARRLMREYEQSYESLEALAAEVARLDRQVIEAAKRGAVPQSLKDQRDQAYARMLQGQHDFKEWFADRWAKHFIAEYFPKYVAETSKFEHKARRVTEKGPLRKFFGKISKRIERLYEAAAEFAEEVTTRTRPKQIERAHNKLRRLKLERDALRAEIAERARTAKLAPTKGESKSTQATRTAQQAADELARIESEIRALKNLEPNEIFSPEQISKKKEQLAERIKRRERGVSTELNERTIEKLEAQIRQNVTPEQRDSRIAALEKKAENLRNLADAAKAKLRKDALHKQLAKVQAQIAALEGRTERAERRTKNRADQKARRDTRGSAMLDMLRGISLAVTAAMNQMPNTTSSNEELYLRLHAMYSRGRTAWSGETKTFYLNGQPINTASPAVNNRIMGKLTDLWGSTKDVVRWAANTFVIPKNLWMHSQTNRDGEAITALQALALLFADNPGMPRGSVNPNTGEYRHGYYWVSFPTPQGVDRGQWVPLHDDGWFAAVQRMRGAWLETGPLGKLLEEWPDDASILDILQSEQDSDNEFVNRVRRELKRFYDDYVGTVGPENAKSVQEWMTNYFPRMLDYELIRKNQQEFIADLMKGPPGAQKGLTREEAEEYLHEALENGGIGAWDEVESSFAPGNTHGKHRAQRMADFGPVIAKWSQKNPQMILRTYVESMIKRIEHDRRLGATVNRKGNKKGFDHLYWQKWLLAAAKAQGANPTQMTHVRKVLEGYKGRLGGHISPAARGFMSGVQTVVNVALLPLAVLSSLVDLGNVYIRSDMTSSYIDMERLARAFTAYTNKDELYRTALMHGLITDHLINDVLAQKFDTHYMTSRWQKVNEKFFRINLLHQWTSIMRIYSMQIAEDFIQKNAFEGTQIAQDKLRELGLTVEEAQEWVNGGKPMTPKVQKAINRFVAESIFTPNATQRPLYGSDPHWMLVWHLKQFGYSFFTQIVARLWKVASDKGVVGQVMALLPVLTLLPLAMVGMELRNLIQTAFSDREPYNHTQGVVHYLLESLYRAGVLGPAQFLLDAMESKSRGKLFLASMAGPTASLLEQTATKEIGTGILRWTPLSTLHHPTRDWLAEKTTEALTFAN